MNISFYFQSIFCQRPLETTSFRESGTLQRVSFSYELNPNNTPATIVDDFLKDWSVMAYIYEAVLQFNDSYKGKMRKEIQKMCLITFYCSFCILWRGIFGFDC